MAETATSTTEAPEAGAESTTEETPGGPAADKTFTQDEVDRIVQQRLGRERKQYADYDDLKAKAEQFDAAEAAKLSEIERITQERDAALSEIDGLKGNALKSAIREAARDAGIDPVGALDALNGSASDLLDPEDMASTMEKLLESRPNLAVGEKKHTPSADQGARGGPTITQVTEAQLATMKPHEIVAAREEGRLTALMGS